MNREATGNNHEFNKSVILEQQFREILSPEFPEFLNDYIDTPPMQRLDGTDMWCGCSQTKLINYPFRSNLDHSIGVALIVWNFTHDEKQTLSALFHDIATPTFKHCVDYLHGDHETQESTEGPTKEIIKDSPQIMALLGRDKITVDEVADYHIYPIADNDTPGLSADRLEYTMSALLLYGFDWSINDISKVYNDLTILTNENDMDELGFKTQKVAEKFIDGGNKCWPQWCDSRNKLTMSFISDVLKRAMKQKIITEKDLYLCSETEIIQKITSESPRLAVAWQNFTENTVIHESKVPPLGKYCIDNIQAKKRYINPLVAGPDGAKRLSEVSPKHKQMIDDFIALTFPRYAWFDFEL